jgi:hypothetical protein
MSNETFHLFRECEGGDTYAARDVAHAKEIWKSDTGQDPDDGTEWEAVPDDAPIKIDDDGVMVTKSAAEWANETDEFGRNVAGCVFGQNY